MPDDPCMHDWQHACMYISPSHHPSHAAPTWCGLIWISERLSPVPLQARLLFVGESNVCRSLMAEIIMRRIIAEKGMGDVVECESKVRASGLVCYLVLWPQHAWMVGWSGEGHGKCGGV